MSKIYTRTGDAGETSLVGGSRIAKNSSRVEAYGTVDEANSCVGHARAAIRLAAGDDVRLNTMLDFVQHRLFDCSSLLATPAEVRAASTAGPSIRVEDITRLESWIDELTAAAGEIDHFVLPAGCEGACRLHIARTVVRRAERRVMDLVSEAPDEVDPRVRKFINRLSDLLFTMARYVNHRYGSGDVFWDPRTP
ncbi:MAG: cob(I)yrinic acid a,c-diamide adenosyltransferase [Anaerosomatales bacterium]|nr:cob(I)yrinic acid a,c-diamide adenosyltransferase [Anaerosomatales bacterium]MDT8434517.1 cob(I)yrinic acid a,c-diamide adenosyltransferase [Anaerosomatales bacterium]